MTEQENQTTSVCPPGTPQPVTAGFPYEAEEDEINLLELFLVLLRNKWLIFWFVFIAGAGAVVVSLLLPNIYRSSATIAPKEEDQGASSALKSLGGLGGMVVGELGLGGSGSIEKLEVILKSRYLTYEIVKKHNLLPVIFSDLWNKDQKKWDTDEPPTLQDAYETIKEKLLSITVDSNVGTVVVGFENRDPTTAKNIVGYYLTELSDLLREEVLRDAGENMRFFRVELDRTMDPLLREKIYAMLATEIEKATFAQAQKYYSFIVLDPPFVPDLKREARPNRKLICILSVGVAFFLATFLAFIKGFLQRIKRDDSDRYEEIAQGFKFWKKAKVKIIL